MDNEVYKLSINKTKEVVGLISLVRFPKELRIEIRLLELNKENIGKTKKYDRVAGILIAYACNLSFIAGFFGYISLVPKTKFVNHYTLKYGFEKVGKHIAIDMEKSEALINKYLLNEK